MILLSEQIKELVRQSSTSAYAIAQQAGIEKSAMSRFMNGGKLTMDKLDRLATVLGVTVTREVSQVKRPSAKGRPPKRKVDEMQTLLRADKRELDGLACRAAKSAFDDEFSSRRGVWFYDDLNVVVIFNNNPFNDVSIRRKELKLLVKELKKLGIKTLARGQYGDILENSEERYTQTLVLDCGEDSVQDVVNIVNEVGSLTSWEAHHPPAPTKKSVD